MSRSDFLTYARGSVLSRYRAYRWLGGVLTVLGALIAAIPALASAGQEAWVLGGTALVTAVAPGVLLVGLGMRDVDRHPLVVALAQGQQPTSFTFRRTLRGHVCQAVVVVEGIPHHFAIPRELMPE